MSIDAVAKFYEKVASDSALQKAFVHATSARIVSFAAEHGLRFTEHDLQTVAEKFQARAEKLRQELKQLHDRPRDVVVANVTSKDADRFMSGLQSDRIYNRLIDVFDVIAKFKSG